MKTYPHRGDSEERGLRDRDPLAHDGGAVPWKEDGRERLTDAKPAELEKFGSAGFFCFGEYGIIGG